VRIPPIIRSSSRDQGAGVRRQVTRALCRPYADVWAGAAPTDRSVGRSGSGRARGRNHWLSRVWDSVALRAQPVTGLACDESWQSGQLRHRVEPHCPRLPPLLSTYLDITTAAASLRQPRWRRWQQLRRQNVALVRRRCRPPWIGLSSRFQYLSPELGRPEDPMDVLS
jgi:hypothetical protein